MKNQIELSLGNSVAPVIVDALPRLPGLRIRIDGASPCLRAHGDRWRLLVLPPRPGPEDPDAVARAILEDARMTDPDVLPLVADAALSSGLRRALERREVSYLDGQGALHLVVPGVIVHVEGSGGKAPRASTTAKGVGATSVRAIQVLLSHPPAEWTVTELAHKAAMSVGQAHRLWDLLTREGLATALGSGPEKRRVVKDPRLLLTWLERQAAARQVRGQLQCSTYASTLPKLCAKVTEAMNRAQVSHAWTGDAAAALQQVGPTAVPRAVLRVSPELPLDRAAALAGIEQTERGANVILWSDTGNVGAHEACSVAAAGITVPVASGVRIYLDLLRERRGEDLAAQYRETILGY